LDNRDSNRKPQAVTTSERGAPTSGGAGAKQPGRGEVRWIKDKGLYSFHRFQNKWMSTKLQPKIDEFDIGTIVTNKLTAKNDLLITAGTNDVFFGRILDQINIGSQDVSLDLWTGEGWRLWYDENNLTNFEIDNLTVRNEMWVQTFILNQVRAHNGNIVATNSGKLKSVSGSGPYTMTFEVNNVVDAAPFAVNDLIHARTLSIDEVTTLSNSQLTVSAVNVGSDAAVITAALRAGKSAPVKGDVFVQVGNTSDSNRQGSVWIISEATANAPYMDVLDGISSWAEYDDPVGTGCVRTRTGNLNGLTATYPTVSGYGTWGDNVYLTGEIGWASLVDASGNPLTDAVTLSVSGGMLDLSGGGLNLTGASTAIQGSKTSFADTDTGFWLGIDSDSKAKFHFGNLTNYIKYDGTDLTLFGGTVNGATINPGAGTSRSLLGWHTGITFSSTDYNTLAWESGTIFFSNGDTLGINAGNTGNIGNDLVYTIYCNNTDTLQVTSTSSDAVGDNKFMVAVCKRTVSGKDIEFQTFGSESMNKTFIHADNIAADSVAANEIVANTITAAECDIDNAFVSALLAVSATITDTLTMGTDAKIVIGTAGKIYTNLKTSIIDTDEGLYIGYNSGWDFGIGDYPNNYMNWDGSAGTLTVQGASLNFGTGSNDKIIMDTDGIKIYNYAGGWQGRIRMYDSATYVGYIAGGGGITIAPFTGYRGNMVGNFTFSNEVVIEDEITFEDRGTAPAHTAGEGKLWADDGYESPLMYTTDNGNDHTVALVSISTTTGAGAFEGRIHINTSANNAYIYADGDWRVIADWS